MMLSEFAAGDAELLARCPAVLISVSLCYQIHTGNLWMQKARWHTALGLLEVLHAVVIQILTRGKEKLSLEWCDAASCAACCYPDSKTVAQIQRAANGTGLLNKRALQGCSFYTASRMHRHEIRVSWGLGLSEQEKGLFECHNAALTSALHVLLQ